MRRWSPSLQALNKTVISGDPAGVIGYLEQSYHGMAVSALRFRLPGRRQEGHEDFGCDDDGISGGGERLCG